MNQLPEYTGDPYAGPPARRPEQAPLPAPFDPYAHEDDGPQLDWRRYLAAVLRYKWAIAVFTLLGTLAGVAAAEFLPESYRAQATIWIQKNEGGNAGPIRTSQLLQASAWQELIHSFVVLDQVVLSERLYLESEASKESPLFAGLTLGEQFRPGEYRLTVDESGRGYTLSTAGGTRVETGEIGGPVGREIGLRWTPPPTALQPRSAVAFTIHSPREKAIELSSALRPEMDRTGNFLRVELSMPTAELAAGVLNAITQRYLAVAGELKRARLDELTAILSEQLAYADSQLTARERQLEGYRVSTITLPSERATPVAPGLEITRDPVFGAYFERKVTLEQLREDRAAIEGALSSNAGGLSLEALEVVPSVSNYTELRTALAELADLRAQLRVQLRTLMPEHPDVQRIQAAVDEMENRTVPALANTLVRQLDTREGTLEDMIDSASGQLQSIPPRVIEEARLRRSVAIAENLYTQLQSKHEESRLAAASALPDVDILDAASVPRRPVRDDKPMVILLAFGSSLGLALLGAVLRDRTDKTIRYPEQVSSEMGLQILGALPRIRDRRGDVDAHVLPALTEALRSIRVSLAYAHGTAGPLMLTISSPGPAEGKTFLASNLALSFSQLGRRTLVIDGDIRRGTLHRALSSERVPGLTDFLAGEASLDQVVKATGHSHLDLLPSGTRRHIGPELLGSAEMKQLIMEMRSRYDVVLVDSPPLAAGVDSLILAALTGSMVLVMRTGATKRSLAESQLHLLDRMPMRILGAILNDVDKTDSGYYQYEQYMYLPNYRAEDEEEAAEELSLPPAFVLEAGSARTGSAS